MPKLHSKTKYFSAQRVAMLSVLTAMALIMFMIESLFPPLFLPGAKMGLSNIFTLVALYLLGPVDAIVLVVVRTTLGSMFTGNMSTLLYSLSAGIVSVIVSAVLVEFVYPRISIVSISVVSAVMHNLTQNLVFCLISNTPQMFAYMPWLALLGIVAGLIVGFAVWFILKAVPIRTFAAILGASKEDFADAQGFGRGKKNRHNTAQNPDVEATDNHQNTTELKAVGTSLPDEIVSDDQTLIEDSISVKTQSVGSNEESTKEDFLKDSKNQQ